MVKSKYALETDLEKSYNEVNEKEWRKRRILDRCVNTYIEGKGKNGKPYLNQQQKQMMRDFLNYLLSSRKSRLKSPYSILDIFSNVARFLRDCKKPLEDLKKKDLLGYLSELQIPEEGKKGLSDTTLLTKQLHIRQFLRWYFDDPSHPSIGWMKISINFKNHMDEAQLLSPEEIKKMVEACGNRRDACIIMIGYECGLRAGELSNILLKNIQDTDYGAKIKVAGKSGERTVFLIRSYPYLKEWINEHPFRSNPNAPLFISFSSNQFGRQLLGHGVLNAVKGSAKRAGIKKNVYTHLLRHSALNNLGKEGFKERDLRIFAGWSGDSKMPDVYLHYGEEEVEKKLLKLNGKEKKEDVLEKEKKNKLLEPKICPKCEGINPATSKYCQCGMVLDLKILMKMDDTRKKADSMMDDLFQNSEFKEVVMKFLKEKINK